MDDHKIYYYIETTKPNPYLNIILFYKLEITQWL